MTAPHLGPGHIVAGRYTVRALLGFTGEVATYHAVASDGREVVVKLYDPAIGQRADVMSQLERTHARLATLPVELVVPVFDSGYDVGTSAPFTVCEKLQVPSLAKLVETGALSTEVVAAVLRGVAQALDAAHAQQLHHHALKPANVFVGPAPSYPVRVTDFDVSVVRQTSPTHEAYALAAPWWAPEQLQPAAVLGPATDVFTSALLAFYSLTGRSFWLSCQASPPDLPAWQLEAMGPRTPVSQRARELGCQLNPAVDGVFARALSVNQPDRPQSVLEIANILAYAGAYALGAYGAQPTEGYAAVAASPPSAGTTPFHEQAAAATPGLPPFPTIAPKKKGASTLPVIIGVIAAVALGSAGVVVLFMRAPENEPSAVETAGSTVPSARSAASSSSAATAEPSGTVESDENRETSDAGADETGQKVEVTIQCVPACDSLLIDNEDIEKPEEKLLLLPGKHTVKATKTGYVTRIETIDVELGKPFAKEYRLVKIGAGKPPPPPPPCGQFLRPCK